MKDIKQVKNSLILKMLSRRVIGRNHMRLETLRKLGWKPDEKGLVKEAINDFIKEGIIIWVKKSKKPLTLNKEKIKSIKLQYAEG